MSHMRPKTCASLGWCCGTSHPRGRAPSAPRPGAHPFSARGRDVPQHPQRGRRGVLQPQARLPGRGLGAGDVPTERERSPGLNPLTRMGRPRTILGRPAPCSRYAGPCAFNGRTPPGMIRPRQTGQSASRGPSPKTYRPGPPGFCGRDLGTQIWPSLTLPVRPVGGVCARPRFRPNTCGFGQSLGRGWRTGPLGQVSPGGEGGRAASLRSAA